MSAVRAIYCLREPSGDEKIRYVGIANERQIEANSDPVFRAELGRKLRAAWPESRREAQAERMRLFHKQRREAKA